MVVDRRRRRARHGSAILCKTAEFAGGAACGFVL
jgi:hypothetical protein